MSWFRTRSKKVQSGLLAFCLLITQVTTVAVPFMPAQSVAADSGNNGTLQVHEQGSADYKKGNEPSVCIFNFEAFGLDANQTGNVTITPKSPTVSNGTPSGNPLVLSLSTDTNGDGATDYVNDGLSGNSLLDGHYKATLDNKFGTDHDDKAKSKVFRVNCPEVKPTITTQVSANAVDVGDSVYDTATLTGDFNHGDVTGTVKFYLCGPDETLPSCSNGGQKVGSTKTVSAGSATSDSYVVTEPGEYCFRASYDAEEDSNYLDATHTNLTTECFTASSTGTITVDKVVSPSIGDTGKFNLIVDGTVYATDIGNGGTTGSVTLPTGSYTVSETAGTGTDLADYSSTYSCTNELSGSGTITPSFAVTAGDHITCTFTNVRLGSITIVKDARPDSTQAFTFTGNMTGEDNANFTLTDDGIHPDLASRTFSGLSEGTYTVTEPNVKNWKLVNVSCVGGSDTDTHNRSAVINLQPGENVTCTFTNKGRPSIVVTKYNDLNRNGQYDEGEPTLPGWDMTLTSGRQCEEVNFLDQLSARTLENDGCNSNLTSVTQSTDGDGTTTFNGLRARKTYTLSETQQTGWHLSNITCNYGEGSVGTAVEDAYVITPRMGETIHCYVGNYRNAVILNLAKTNNRPSATIIGDTVTYTLTVSLPENSGISYDTHVVDLPPSGFTYEEGSWTASSTNPSHDVAADVSSTGGPNYGSPGDWFIGTMLPGEVITLTYRALIGSSVNAGTYPDTAFAQGCGVFTDGDGCSSGDTVFSNLTLTDSPFVGTRVTVAAAPLVIPTRTVLVNTGLPLFAYILMATSLMGLAVTIARWKFSPKGGQL